MCSTVGYVCFLQVGQALAVDLTAEEECCTSAALQVAVNAKGHLCAVSQRGSAGINPGIMQVSRSRLQQTQAAFSYGM